MPDFNRGLFFMYYSFWSFVAIGNLRGTTTCCPIKWILIHNTHILSYASQNVI